MKYNFCEDCVSCFLIFLVCVVFPLLVVTVKIVFTVEDVIDKEFLGDPPKNKCFSAPLIGKTHDLLSLGYVE